MKKVAALYMCTGQYLKLWPEFLASAEKYLLKQCEVHYFVFTDADHLEGEESNSGLDFTAASNLSKTAAVALYNAEAF